MCGEGILEELQERVLIFKAWRVHEQNCYLSHNIISRPKGAQPLKSLQIQLH